MSHGPTRIDSKGFCIYCGRTDCKLTDEHIVPFFIGGKHILEKASCLDCADVTKRFEQDVARELWGDARISYDSPSRRKKKKPTHIVLPGRHSKEPSIKVRYKDYPAPMVFYIMTQAGILRGLPKDKDISKNWLLKYIADETKIKKFEAKYPGRLVAKFRHVPESFGKLIAKIGYGQILCSLEPTDFNPICLPYIKGIKRNISYIVGGRETLAPITLGIGYSMATGFVGDSKRAILIAEVRLLGDNGTPTYHVVVGTVAGENKVKKVRNKIVATHMVDLNPEFDPSKTLSDDFHWMPKIWPVDFEEISKTENNAS